MSNCFPGEDCHLLVGLPLLLHLGYQAVTYMQRAKAGKIPRSELKKNFEVAENRIKVTATEAAKPTGRTGV